MSRSRRDDSKAGADRSAAERERARLEREARRAGQPPPDDAAPPPAYAPPPTDSIPPEPPYAEPIPIRRSARASRSGSGRAADSEGGVLRIQPRPPAPPAAPAGALDDETERPIGIRRVRRPTRPIVTPPGDTPAGPARRRRRPRGNRLVALAAIAVLAFFVIGSLLLFQPFGSAEGSTVRVTIPEGAGAGDIGKQLADAGIVDSAFFFNLRATLSGKRDSLRSGPHTLRKHMTYGNAIAALSAPDKVEQRPTVDVTIPEGRSRREIAPLAAKAGLRGSYLEASKRFAGALNPFRYDAPSGTRSLEGFLFPATYELDVGAPARDLVERQLAAFRDNFAGVNLSRARRRNLTAYDVLIIASMVEREAQLAKERPIIAAVIYNRLKDGTPLGIDATTRYALNKPSGALKQSELDDTSSPYNTRKRAGLPPTPIGNPGLSSIRAAANPANVKFRYFVVKPGTCGEHVFAETIQEHDRNVARYAGARAEAGGKSPTTC